MNSGLLIRPIITEHSIKEAEKGKFTFEVALHANKFAIKQEIENRFKVHVEGVATRVTKGKTKRVGVRRNEITLKPVKKATVALASGEKIDMFDLGATE